MSREVEVCAECVQKCLSVHRKKKNSSSVPSSFFKVMIGRDFSSVLYLPPKFGPTMSTLVHEKTILEDSSGQQWKVIVSIVNRSLAFQEGWNVFSLEHGLKIGDFLVFNYIGGLHFVVKIYDDSGCEKLDFPKIRNQKKRRRDRTASDVRDDMFIGQGSKASIVCELDVQKAQSQHNGFDVDGAQNNKENTSKYNNSEGRAQSLYKAEHHEDPYYMIDTDFGDKEREDRSPMLDVFSHEILNNSRVGGTGNYKSHISQNDAIICNKDPLLEDILGKVASRHSSEFELTGRGNFLEEIDKRAYIRDRHSCRDRTSEPLLITYNNSSMSNREVRKCQFAEDSEIDQVVISKEMHTLHIGNCQNTEKMINGIHESFNAPTRHGKVVKMVKKELLDMTPVVCSHNEKLRPTWSSDLIQGEGALSSHIIIKDQGRILHSVKAEPVDVDGSLSQITAIVSCVVPPDGVAHMLAIIILQAKKGKYGGFPSGSTEEIVAGPLP